MKKVFISIITAMGLVLSCEKAPEEVTVTSVSIGQASAELLIGETVQLSASVQPSNATDKSVAWATSNQSVATVSNSGLVTAIAEGTSTITASAGGKSATCTVIVSKPKISVSSITLDKESVELRKGESVSLLANVAPEDATDRTVTWVSSDSEIASVDGGKVNAVNVGVATITVIANDGSGVSASCNVTVRNPDPIAIDLGLSVKWASWNLGASKPEEFGDYFAWGETTTKDVYSDNTYKWFDGDIITKYNTDELWGPVDNKTQLEKDDDAAYVIWGEDWRIPTPVEWEELYTNCSWSWTKINEIEGFTVTCETNGNSIFLPATGWRYDNQQYLNGSGKYWASELRSYEPDTAYTYAFSKHSLSPFPQYSYRRNGLTIRPVSD